MSRSMKTMLEPTEDAVKGNREQKRGTLLDRAFDSMIGSQLSKIEGKREHTREDDERYRTMMEKEREAAVRKKRKHISKEQEELARSTGLSGQVVALMSKEVAREAEAEADADAEGERSKRKKKKKKKKRKKRSRTHERYESDSSSSEEERESRHRRGRKRHRKERPSQSS